MTFSREDVARVCRAYGGFLWVPPTISGERLLWAISGCESSFGADAAPRHEPAYDVGGAYAGDAEQTKLLQLYGSAGACSYGPWQEMLVNVQPPASPEDMLRLNRCGLAVATFLNRRVLHAEQASTVEQIAYAYNSGKWRWEAVPRGVERYAAECRKYYESEPLPDVA